MRVLAYILLGLALLFAGGVVAKLLELQVQ